MICLILGLKDNWATEVAATYAQAVELSHETGDSRQLFSVLDGLWLSYIVKGECRKALATGQQLFALAQTLDDPQRSRA